MTDPYAPRPTTPAERADILRIEQEYDRLGVPDDPAIEQLTPAQKRLLNEVRQRGHATYNGRARPVIEALERAGLVTVDWDMQPHVKGNGISLSWRITVHSR